MTDTLLATIATPEGPSAAVVRGDAVYPVRGRPSMRALLDDWDSALAEIDAGGVEDGTPLVSAQLLPPVLDPPHLFMAGANYADHAREMRGLGPDDPVPRSPEGPFMFLRPTSTLIGAGEPIVVAPGCERVDWEVELAVVIGRAGRNISEADALDHVAGYTVVNDVSVRDKFKRAEGAEPPMTFDWLRQKGWATTCPAGPWIVPARDIENPGDLVLRLELNGVVEQESNTSEMIFSIEEQIAYLSVLLPLQPGDIICTGTPAGVGMGKGRFLSPGDTMVAEVGGIGRLASTVEG